MYSIFKTLSILALVLNISYSAIWRTLDKFSNTLQDSQFSQWNIEGYEGNIINTCGDKQIIGGFLKFGQGVNLERTYNDILAHEQVRIRFKLWVIDFWFMAESFFLHTDDVLQYSFVKTNMMAGSELCGSVKKEIFYEEVIDVDITFPHTQDSLNLKLSSDVFGENYIASWGISDLHIEYFTNWDDPCQSGQVDCNDGGPTDQECQDSLNHLNEDSLTNKCEPVIEDGELKFLFTVEYLPPFKLDPQCLQQKVEFEGQNLQKTEDLQSDYWTFEQETQKLQFLIDHSDFDGEYNCEFTEFSEKYVWVCDMAVTVLYRGYEQLTYEFKIQFTINRDARASDAVVDVIRNEVQGECCENALNVKTQIRFCTDYTCNSYLESPFVFERKQDVFVEHYIQSLEFQEYYLEGVQIKLGVFFPEVIKKDESQQGRVIYHIRSNIALDDLIVDSIARIHKEPISRRMRRRNLKNFKHIGYDYKVKANSQITIQNKDYVEEVQQIVYTSLEEEKNFLRLDNPVIYVSLISIFSVAFLVIQVAIYYKCKKIRKQQQEEEDNLKVQQEIRKCKLQKQCSGKNFLSERNPSIANLNDVKIDME